MCEPETETLSGKREEKKGYTVRTCLREFLLPILITVGVVAGVALGYGLRQLNPGLTKVQATLLGFPGDLMIQMMKMLLLPITVTSVMSAVGKMEIHTSGRMGMWAIIYYLSTLALASTLGLIIAFTVRPGERVTEVTADPSKVAPADAGLAFIDLLRNMFPDNLIEACFTKKKTTIIGELEANSMQLENNTLDLMTSNYSYNDTIGWANHTTQSPHISVIKTDGINMIGLLMFSIAFGCILSTMGEEGKKLLALVEVVFNASIKLILIVVWTVPVAVLFMTAANICLMEDPGAVMASFAIFLSCLLGGLIVHGFLVLPLIYFIIVRRNPYRFQLGMVPAMFMAFATESSAATLPYTMKCLEEKNRVDKRVIQLIAPIGATVNMDGTALYLTLLSIFVAQLHGIYAGIAEALTVCILSVSVAIGVAGIPGAGGGAMEILVLSAMGYPTDNIAFIVVFNWLMARFRTVVNILGDAMGAGIVEKLSKRELRKLDALMEMRNGHLELLPSPRYDHMNDEHPVS